MSNELMKRVELVTVPEIMVRSERKVITNFPQGLAALMNNGFQAIQSAGQMPTGAPIVLYHDEVYTPEQVDTECAWPVGDAALATETLPAVTAARYVHTGPYDQMEQVYLVIMQWIEENGYRPLTPMREVYLNDPAVTAPEDLVTEVIIPVEKLS